METTLVRMRLSLGPLGRMIGCVFNVLIDYKKIDKISNADVSLSCNARRICIDFDSQD